MNKEIHFVGIKGVGMTALAIILKEQGFQVSGSDTGESFVTDQALQEAQIEVSGTFDESHISKNLKQVIYSGAYHPKKNIELKTAIKLNIPTLTQQEALAEIVKDKKLIAVAGVGGKTTTSAMISHVLRESGRKVGYFVGAGKINGENKPGGWGEDELFVAEADEYANSAGRDNTPKLLLLEPTYAVITNIMHDHPDIYKTEKNTIDTFKKFLEQLKPDGKIYLNFDDPISMRVANEIDIQAKIITIGKDEKSDWQIKNIEHRKENTVAALGFEGEEYTLKLHLIADYNVRNATQAAAVAHDQGISWDVIQNALGNFSGVGRRQEFVGKAGEVLLYDDYAHHPHEIKATIQAFKNRFPDRRIWVLFESHTFTRTAVLLSDFIEALTLADKISIMPIFSSAREKPEKFKLSKEILAKKLKEKGKDVNALSFEETPQYVKEHSQDNDLILTMGAGKVYELHEKIQQLI